jgi:subtilisin family serine protease
VRLERNLVDAHKSPRGEVHGTAVAGVIASVVNNSEGIIGVAPDASIAALRACWPVAAGSPTAQCSSFSLAQALDVVYRLAPKVLNLSLAGPEDPLLARLLDRITARGIVVVAAEPEARGAARFPAAHPRVLVAHSSADPPGADGHYRFGAPATEVLTTTPGASYAFLSGNSLAAAHTTGVIALLMEHAPDLDVDSIAVLLAETTTAAATGLRSINACRALDRLNGTRLCDRSLELVRF